MPITPKALAGMGEVVAALGWDLEFSQAENSKLKARVAELEKENEALKAEAEPQKK